MVGPGDGPPAPLAPLPTAVRRIAFLGTPAIAVPALAALVDTGFDVAVVITGEDRRRGRGSATSPTPVKQAALERGLAVAHGLDALDPVQVDLAVVVAFGRLIPASVLAKVPMVNIHFSLLPRWRGAAPVERAILAGDSETGVCIMHVEEGLDTGGVLACRQVPLSDNATADSVRSELAALGASLLTDVLTGPLPQPIAQHGPATYAAKVSPADVALDWSLGAADLARRVRVGGAWTTFRGKRLVVAAARAHPAADTDPLPGVIDGTCVGTADGTLELVEVVPAGRQRSAAGDWLRGARPVPGESLGGGDTP